MQPPSNFRELIYLFLDLIQIIIPIISGLALLTFFWGLVKFIARVGGDEKAITEGKSLMIWGVIGLFVMVSLWGILRFASGDIFSNSNIQLPILPTP